MNTRGVKEQNARLKLQLHYERNEGKRVIQTKIKSGNTNPTSDKDGKDPPTPLTPPTDNTPTTPPPEKDRKLSNVSKMNKSSVKDLTEVKGRLISYILVSYNGAVFNFMFRAKNAQKLHIIQKE